MGENFRINDDRRRLYGDELGIESNKYNHAILRLLDSGDFSDGIFSCIVDEVLDLDNPEESGDDEGIRKGELHKRNRVRFASGVFKAFFDEKIIDERLYDKLFKNLRECILEDYLGPHQEREKRIGEYAKLAKERERLLAEFLSQGVKLRSGRVLPSNDQKAD